MDRDLKPIDIREFPELRRLAEEVRDAHEPMVLRCGSEAIAKLVPVRRRADARTGRKKTEAEYQAFLGSAGAWEDVDVDAFLEANRVSRDRSIRPPVEL